MSSARNKTMRTTFLDLPAELRNQIYRLALVYPWPVNTHSTAWHRKFEDTRKINLTLLRASRQIHHEASPIFYGVNEFVVPTHSAEETSRKAWSMRMGKNIVHLRKLMLSIYPTSEDMDVFKQNLQEVVFTLKEAGPNLRELRVYLPYWTEQQKMLMWDELKEYLLPLPFMIGSDYPNIPTYDYDIAIVRMDFERTLYGIKAPLLGSGSRA